MDIKKAALFSFNNRCLVEQSNDCGCYSCGKSFPANTIKEWTDNWETAICPLCAVDCVLPDAAGYEISESSLKQIREYWFPKKS